MSLPPAGTARRPHDLRPAWSESERFVPRRFVKPVLEFLRIEAAGGVVMLAAALLALLWANSPWAAGYEHLWETHLTLELGGWLHLDHSLREWVNDALMVIFFFVVGLEIKRELVVGELRDPRAVALPVAAAIGGMVVPALIYLSMNAGTPAARGWGVPMATDIAFAVGVVSLLGRRVPVGVKLLLLTLAIVDDIGAILVIAIFYTENLALGWLATAVAGLAVVVVLQRLHVRALVPYLATGTLVWLALLESGVHATLAGVALGLLTPTVAFFRPERYGDAAGPLVSDVVARTNVAGPLDHHSIERVHSRLRDVVRLSRESISPLDRLEHALAPWSSYVVVPLFALANAGVRLRGDVVGGALSDPIFLGVALGLVVGKTAGVAGASWLVVRSGLGRLPSGASMRHVVGIAVLAGIGFTVALFVTALAFDDQRAIDSAKLAIFAASLLAGVGGFLWLRQVARHSDQDDRVHDEPELVTI